MNQELVKQQTASAVALYQQGNAQEAIARLQRLITDNPTFTDAHFCLGCCFQANHQPHEALRLYKHVLQIQPDHIDALINMGNTLITLEQYDAALDCYSKALQLQPRHTDLLSNRGHLLTELKRYDEALASLDQALAINPKHITAINNKAFLLFSQEKFDEALVMFNQALDILPNDLLTLTNRCQLLIKLKRSEEALIDCQHILANHPNHMITLKTMLNILVELKRFHEAIDVADRALSISPDDDQLILGKATLLKITLQYDKSLALFNIYLSRHPDEITPLIDRGNVFSGLDQLENALNDFGRVIALEPNNVAAWINSAIVFNKCRLHKQATECYQEVLKQLPDDAGAYVAMLLHMQHMCYWQSMDDYIKKLKTILSKNDYLESYQLSRAMPSTLLSVSGITPYEQLLFAKKYTLITAPETPARTFYKKPAGQKIHVAYFSPDFNQHPVSQLMVEIFELHNREQFKITAYSAKVSDNSKLRARVEKSVDHFVDITTISDPQVVQKVLDDHVDIIVDLSGYTDSSRSHLLALRLAPIQVNYLGYLGTMGADFIDYLIADNFLVPPGKEIFYTEKIMRLPSYQANDRQCAVAEKPTRAACGLPENSVVFCCFNINYKITPDVFDVWCRLLHAIPDSILWLYTHNSEATENLYKEAANRGINQERLIFARWLPIEQHLARVACADLFLDTTPYNAGTTASNALWVGLPVITFSGETFSSRMAGSLLTALDVPELITYSLEDYYQLAYELATQHERRELLRQKIIANKDTTLLFDSVRFTHSLEAAYQQMMDNHKKYHLE